MLSTALKYRLLGTLLIVYVSGPPDPGFYQQAQADSEDNESCMDWDKYEEIVAAEEQKKCAKCPFIDDEAIETSDYSDGEVVIKKKKRAQRLVSYSDSSSSVVK